MKFSENWLRGFVNPPLNSEELAHVLTMAGIEVDSIEPVAAMFEKVVVAEVVSVEKHPAAERLSVCLVKTSATDNNLLQIVCGAPNVSAGVKVPCALVGANLPGFAIKQAKLRGLDSFGMLCSAKELGIGDAADGLLLLPHDAPVGEDFRSYYALDDRIFTLSLTPNRADCLGLWGIAREVAAITATHQKISTVDPVAKSINETIPVKIIATDACPLYCGRIIRGVDLSVPTPLWMLQRLERSGIRSINSIVDITNYVLMETGQPMHAFDLAKIDGAINVRFAASDERLTVLNGSQIDLNTQMLIIADNSKPLALAGIMGGMESGVTLETVDIFLESAFFDPRAISGKSFQLGFSSDSAYRFERGVDFAETKCVLERASQLIGAICGGKAGPITEVKNQLPQRIPVTVRIDRVKRVLGIEIDQQTIGEYFKRLGFDYTLKGGAFSVLPPSYRFDLAIEEDFIEELARLYGYDRIPIHYPRADMVMLAAAETKYDVIDIKKSMVARDYQEVVNYAFVDAEWELDLANNATPIALKNPIASQMNVMRSTLIGGLISNLQFNLNRKQTRVRLFELGYCFIRDKDHDCRQVEKFAGLCYGDVLSEQWGATARTVDFFDVKADVEVLFGKRAVHFEKFDHPALHPGKSAQITMTDKAIGWIGELHPNLQKKYDLPKNVMLFELEFTALLNKTVPIAKEISKFQVVRRDIAVIVDNDISVYSLLACMLAAKPSIVSEISLFDIYRGKGMENNKKSLAFRFLLQDTEKTLTDEEVDCAVTKLVDILSDKFGAALRT